MIFIDLFLLLIAISLLKNNIFRILILTLYLEFIILNQYLQLLAHKWTIDN